jgi:tetratricopeptide (TPR) repeat protein
LGTENGPQYGDAEVHFERACQYETVGRWKMVLEECDATIEIDPSFADAHNLRGIVLEELGRPGEAAQAYETAIALDPAFDEAIRNLWELEREAGIRHELVTIATFVFPMDAYVPQSKLDSEGIWSFVADEQIVNLDWRYCFAVGRIKLQVRDSDVPRAMYVLKELPPEFICVDADQPRCPACGSGLTRYEKYNLRLVFASWLFLGVALPFPRRRWRCWDCGHRWKPT